MPLFEDQTPEIIRSRILSRMESNLQTREGSYTSDMVSPVAFELWRVCMTLDEFISAFYVDENSGKYLDMHAELLGLARRQGTKASAVINFTGRDGATIPAGTSFFTASGLEFALSDDVVLVDGAGTGTLTASQVGDEYNVDPGEVDRILRNISGLDSFYNDSASGGTDQESDASLYARIVARRKEPPTSGNESHYKEWALSCNGVGDARVTPLWNGPGTVLVIILGYDKHPVDDVVTGACADYIETKRPVGACVTVMSAAATGISVSATVTLDANMSFAAVRAAFVSKLDTYLQSLAFVQYVVHINQIGALLLSVDGVIDYADLTVNGGKSNVEIDSTAVPVIGEVTLSCAD